MHIIETIENLCNLRHLTPASDLDIINAEKSLGICFASEYRIYVSKYGVISAKGIELTGVTDIPRLNVVDVTKAERSLNKNFPDGMYVIENIAIDGILLLQNAEGEIFEITPNSKPKKMFDNLSEYLNSQI